VAVEEEEEDAPPAARCCCEPSKLERNDGHRESCCGVGRMASSPLLRREARVLLAVEGGGGDLERFQLPKRRPPALEGGDVERGEAHMKELDSEKAPAEEEVEAWSSKAALRWASKENEGESAGWLIGGERKLRR
jgi:hypothetical protein